ncbi:MAG: flagellum-specific ATP synthase FliI, partial [Lachnospiraceae bacterium]|nr:flagellum-specific ATP synthase FliI [Lachnospiraceae bacterium]
MIVQTITVDFSKYQKLKEENYFHKLGKVVNVVGLTVESAGPDARLGDICSIFPEGEEAKPVMAEVVGFKDKKTLLMPYEAVDGIGLNCLVQNMGVPLS